MKKFNGRFFTKKLLFGLLFLISSFCFSVMFSQLSNISAMRTTPRSHSEHRIKAFNNINLAEETTKLNIQPIGIAKNSTASNATVNKSTVRVSVINSDYYNYRNVKLSDGVEIKNYAPGATDKIEALVSRWYASVSVGDEISIKLNHAFEQESVDIVVTVVGILDGDYASQILGARDVFLIPNISSVLAVDDYFLSQTFNYFLFFDKDIDTNSLTQEYAPLGYVLNDYTQFNAQSIAGFHFFMAVSLLLFLFIGLFYCYLNGKLVYRDAYFVYEGSDILSKSVIISTFAIDALVIGLIVLASLTRALSMMSLYILIVSNILTMIVAYVCMVVKICKRRNENDTNKELNQNV